MIASTFSPGSTQIKWRTFERRSMLPLESEYLWRIKTGAVRTLTSSEDGNTIGLGLWGPGDVVGRALSKADPYQIECLTSVQVSLVPLTRYQEVNEAIIQHIQQFQEFLEIMHCRSVDSSLMRLLLWMAKRFGRTSEKGQTIELRLTHQEIAEFLGATRVTITRLLNDFEKRGIIQRLPHQYIVLHDQHPFWHYEI
jgi:CRP-like cAMP-binding protein